MISFVLYLIVPIHLPNYVYGRKEIALLDKNFDSGHVRLCRVQCVNAIICLCIGYSLDLTYFIFVSSFTPCWHECGEECTCLRIRASLVHVEQMSSTGADQTPVHVSDS